jgi:NAD(P)-dependent dehydrogenase (short-subunit alcohol dehydrogenase family)
VGQYGAGEEALMAVVLITGCSSGIGLATALAFAQRGDRVFATMRNPAKAGPLRDAAQAAGVAVEIVQLDVADDESVRRGVGEVLDAAGRIDVLVNNAGVGHYGTVELMPWDWLRETFETNFFGVVRMLRAVLPSMRERTAGVIVNVSSANGRMRGLGFAGMYGASKHALGTMSEALQTEVEPFGIRVVVIEPGAFRSNLVENGAVQLDPGSPYAALEAAEYAAGEAGDSDAEDPSVVAAAIVEAAVHPGPLHVLVGDDAELWVAAAESSTYEQWRAKVERIRRFTSRL